MVRKNNDGYIKMSAPCNECTKIIKILQIKKIIYTIDNNINSNDIKFITEKTKKYKNNYVTHGFRNKKKNE